MGWRSTMDITREDCIQEIMRNLFSANDDTLEEVLCNFADQSGNRLYGHNFSIVHSYDDSEEGDEWEGRRNFKYYKDR